MNPQDLKAVTDLVSDVVFNKIKSDPQRLDSLFYDLKSISDSRGTLPDLLVRVGQVFDDHEFDRVRGEIYALPGFDGPNPPDDLSLEMIKLADKLERLKDPANHEYKLPHRTQINVDLLVSIFIEILDILKKLSYRSNQQSFDDSNLSVSTGITLIGTVKDNGEAPVIILPDRHSAVLACLDDNDFGIAELAFNDIAQGAPCGCLQQIRRLADGSRQIRCLPRPCPKGCKILSHPRGVPADPEKVKEVEVDDPGVFNTVPPKFVYWCSCR